MSDANSVVQLEATIGAKPKPATVGNTTELNKMSSLRAELDVIAQLESNNGQNLLPRNPNELSFGRYHLNTLGLVDAWQNKVAVPSAVNEMLKDWDNMSQSQRYLVQNDLFDWMKKNQASTDGIAEGYYEKVVRPRAGNTAPVAIMSWQSPGETKKDLETLGMSAQEVGTDPKKFERFVQHIWMNGADDRANRAGNLWEYLPVLEQSKKYPDRQNPPMLMPKKSSGVAPSELSPFPTTDIDDPWMQIGHATVFHETMKKQYEGLDDQTIEAATRLSQLTAGDPTAHGIAKMAAEHEALIHEDPIDTAAEYTNLPYSMFKATGEVVRDQMENGVDFTRGLLNASTGVVPLMVGGLFFRRFSQNVPTKLKSEGELVKEATDEWTKALQSATQRREGAIVNLETKRAAGDTEGLKQAMKDAKKAQRDEDFARTVLDKHVGEQEIERLKLQRAMLLEDPTQLSNKSGTKDVTDQMLSKALKDIDKRIAIAERRNKDAAGNLIPFVQKEMDEAFKKYHNEIEQAKLHVDQISAAGDELLKTKKVTIKSIQSADPNAPIDVRVMNAEVKLVQSAAKHVQMLAEAYEMSGGNLKLGHELRKSIAQYASMFAVPVQQMRLGQAIKSIEGTSIQSRTFNEIMRNLEGVDPIALNRIWSIAQSDRHKLSLLKNLANPGVFKGSVMQVLVNSLISSPATAFWNTMSMGAMSLSRANELRILGKIDPVRNAPDNASLFLTSLYGFYGKIIAGDVAARKTMKTALKDANIYADTATAQGLRDKYSFNFRESIPGRAGKIINFPTQLTAYTDAIFGTAIKTAASEVAANNAVWMEKSASRLTMSEAQFQTELKLARASKLSDENATVMFQGKPTLIKDIADNEAAKITLMANPETEAGKYIEAMSKNSLLARMVIPFPRPFILSAEQALQHFPIVAKWMPTVSADLAAGGARGAAAQAKITNGTQMAGLFAMFAGAAYAFQNEDGTEKFGFTGSGPSVKEQRAMWAATNRPDTLYVGGKEISLAKLGYPGQVMAATANVMGFINDAANMGHTDIDVTDLTATLIAAWTSLAASEPFAEDVKTIAAAFVEADGEALARIAERKAVSLVPYSALIRDLDHILSGTRKTLELEMGKLPKTVVPISYWGDPTAYYGTQNPFSTLIGLTEKNQPDYARKNAVQKRFEDDEVVSAAPGRTLVEGGVSMRLSLEEHYALKQYWAKANIGGTLLDNLESAVNSSTYKKLLHGDGQNDSQDAKYKVGTKQMYIDAVTEHRRKVAQVWLFTQSPYAKSLQERMQNTIRETSQAISEAQQFDRERTPQVGMPFGMGNQP